MIRLFLLIVVLLILSLGLVMIFSTTSADFLDHDLYFTKKETSFNQERLLLEKERAEVHKPLLKQLTFGVLGFFFALGMVKLGSARFLQLSPLFFVALTFLLALVFVPGIGKEVNGSKRWIQLFVFSFQPSEFLKLVAPAFFIESISKIGVLTIQDFCLLVLKLAVPLFLILIEPNNGTCAVIGLILVVLCFLSKVPWRFWALPLVVFACIGVVFALKLPYVQGRLTAYLHPERDLLGRGHQPYQAKIAAGSGQLFGKGPGNSLQKLSYLPEAQNDYIAAIFAEEFGFLGICFLITLYLCLMILGYAIAMQAKEEKSALLAASYTFLIGLQAALNLGVVSGLLPSTGLNLPFFSQGGSSLIANAAALGLLWSIASDEQKQQDCHYNRRNRRAHLSRFEPS